MAMLHKFWKLKAFLRLTSVCEGEFSGVGRLRYTFDPKTFDIQITSAAVSGFFPILSSHSSLRRRWCSFARFVSSWTLAAVSKPSISFSDQYQALSPNNFLSHLSATFSICYLYPRRLENISFQIERKLRGSYVENTSEASSSSPTGQFVVGASSQKEITTEMTQLVEFEISGGRRVSKKFMQCERTGVQNVEACEYRVSVPRYIYTSSVMGIGGFCEADEVSVVGQYAVGSKCHVEDMILEECSVEVFLDEQRVSSPSIAVAALDSVSSEMVQDDAHGTFVKKELSALEYVGCPDLRCSEGPSTNFDSAGLRHRNLGLLSGACCLPHPNKVKCGGEDAYFICSQEQVVGVADGVGGWSDVGVNAGDYARELMLQSKLAVAQEPYGDIDPVRVMILAHARTKCRGSSTACILAVSDYGLQAANLGDSGFVLIRNCRIIFKSPIQQHQFNIPFQLESGGSDSPSIAEVFSLQVVPGDVLVAGTDGLFDNLYDNELIRIVIHSTRAGLDPQVTSRKIAALARERAEDRDRQTPFSTAAQEAGFRFYGGKMDDITVIVSYVTTIKPGVSMYLPKL